MAGLDVSAEMSMNRPVIWPSGQKTPQGARSSGGAPTGAGDVEETGQVKEGFSLQTTGARPTGGAAPTAGATATAAAGATATTGAPLTPAPSIATSYSVQQLVNVLLSLGIQPRQENVQLATLMVQHGIELTAENFAFIKQAAQMAGGVDALSSQLASMVAISRGLADSPAALSALSQFLAKNPQIASQLINLQQMLVNLASALNQLQGLPPSLQGQLATLAGSLGGLDQKMAKGEIGRGEIAKDARALKALLSGLEGAVNKAQNQPGGKAAASALAQAYQQTEELLQNLLAGSIFSQPKVNTDTSRPNIYYAQMPNLAGQTPQQAEIAIKREERGKKKINPKKTVLILGLEALALGKLAIEIGVDEKKLDFKFTTALEEANSLIRGNWTDLRERLESKGYEPQGLRVVTEPAKTDFKQYLMPVLNLEDLRRVSIQA